MSRSRHLLARLAGAAISALLFAGVACAQAARPAASASNTIVQQPRSFGYTLGDVLTQRLLLPADGRSLDPAALPRPGRISGWLERRPLQWQSDDQGRRWLLVSYQIVNAPQTLTAIALPALSLPMSAGAPLQIGAHLLSVGPLTPQTALGKGGLLDVRPDRPAPLEPIAPIAQRMQRYLLALAAILSGWLLWWAWRNRREAKRLPFARAWSRMRRIDPGGDEAWLCLHQALNESAGFVLRAAALPDLLARAPHLQALRAPIEQFYACSDRRFFSPAHVSEPLALRALCRALYLAEKRARP